MNVARTRDKDSYDDLLGRVARTVIHLCPTCARLGIESVKAVEKRDALGHLMVQAEIDNPSFITQLGDGEANHRMRPFSYSPSLGTVASIHISESLNSLACLNWSGCDSLRIYVISKCGNMARISTSVHSTLELRRLSCEHQIASLQRLRFHVWHGEGAIINQPEKRMISDCHDEHAMHWGVFDGDEIVGGARLCLHDFVGEAPDAQMFSKVELPTPVASMNRLVVCRNYRGLGIGTTLDKLRIEQAKQLGALTVIITPTNVDSRKKSLASLGFVFIPGVDGHPAWSPSVRSCAAYLILNQQRSDEG